MRFFFSLFNPTGIQVNGHFQRQSLKQTHFETQLGGESYMTVTTYLEVDILIIDAGNNEEKIIYDTVSKALLELSTCKKIEKQIDTKAQGLRKREKNVLER